MQKTKNLLLQRAVAHTVVQNFGDAVDDLTTAIAIDPDFALAYWQRGVCAAAINELSNTQGMEAKIKEANALYDLNKALELIPDDPYIHYDRGNLYFSQGEYAKAIEDYDIAIKANHLPEAYYNRGLAYIHNGNQQQGIADLSKAGELGIYSAYGMIKKYSK